MAKAQKTVSEQLDDAMTEAANLANDLATLAYRYDHGELARLASLQYAITVALCALAEAYATTEQEAA